MLVCKKSVLLLNNIPAHIEGVSGTSLRRQVEELPYESSHYPLAQPLASNSCLKFVSLTIKGSCKYLFMSYVIFLLLHCFPPLRVYGHPSRCGC